MKKNNRCFIIAEIGVNHNNNISTAKKMISLAKKAGADAVKFQTFKACRLARLTTPKVKYQKRSGSKNETHYQMLKKLELSEKNHIVLKRFCKIKKIEFISTPYDLESLKFLLSIGVKTIKIISTGMSTLDEIEETVKLYKKYKNKKVSILHCVSNYPSSDKSLNLKNIITLRNKFRYPIGFSDHSSGNIASIIALSYGAQIVEKHFTLDHKMKGPDHLASSTPDEFADLVKCIRRSEIMKGSYFKKIQNEEKSIRQISRKSLIYKKDLDTNHFLKESDLTAIRPGNGLIGNKLKFILNKKLKKKVYKNNLVNLNDFKK